jgi:hypothetical protein
MASSVYPDRNGSIVAVAPAAGDAGSQGPPGSCAGVALADAELALADAEPEVADAEPEVADAEPEVADAELALAESAAPAVAGLELTAPELCGLDRTAEAAVAEGPRAGWSVPVAGLNVATDSMAPATRHTARMLASSGITVPGPRNGPVTRRSRRRRRRARSSRW